MRTTIRVSALLLMVLAASCSRPAGPDAAELLAAYEAALARTEPLAARFEPDSPAERAALEGLRDYFSLMDASSVRAKTRAVYAANGWLFDNLAVVEGGDSIEAYFLKAATEVDALQVEFLQIARADADYFVRWRMEIQAANLADAPIVSYGMTQFRFDSAGRVLIHRDFWDAATGLYEYLPGVGGWLERLRLTLGELPPDA